MFSKISILNKPVVAGLLLLFSFFSKVSLAQQCLLDVIEFEIVSIPPTAPWRAVSLSPMAPGAFNAYYQVNLKARVGNLPTSLQIRHLTFNGEINVNNFTSKIDPVLTSQLSPQQYLSFLDMGSLANGEVNWEIGTELSCANGELPTVISIPPGTSSLRLFTIVIQAVPTDEINWQPNFNGFLDNCPGCVGNILVRAANNSTLIVFPAPAISNNPIKLKFEYDYNFGLSAASIKVFLDSPLSGLGVSGFGKMDGVIHIRPEMLGSSNIDLNVFQYGAGPDAGIHNFQHKVRKNADHSFDIYFSFENFPDPDDPNAPALTNPQLLFPIIINGLYNISQGGLLHCSLTAGRWTLSPLASNSVTNRLNSVPADIDIPGEELCDPSIKISGDIYKTTQDCSVGVRFELTHNAPQPVELSRLKFQLTFVPTASNGATPGIVTSTVPFALTSGSLQTLPNGSFNYIYEHQGAISLTSGTYVEVPIQIDKGCVDYYITIGEAVLANNANGTCALDVFLGSPLCDPKVHGRVISETSTHVPDYRVRLESINNSNYELEDFDDCKETFSFCPDPDEGPFRLRILKQPTASILCGVTPYDCVLITKQILGISETLDSPYKKIAANADVTPMPPSMKQSFSTLDVTRIRQTILGIYMNNFGPQSAPSWWYIKESLQLPFDPLGVGIQPYESANTADVPANGSGNYGGFFAVKVGDVNLSCTEYCNGQRPGKGQENKSLPYLTITSEKIRRVGNLLYIPVYSEAPFDIIAMQAGFRFDPAVLHLKSVIPNPEVPITNGHFGCVEAAAGILRFAWDSYDGYTNLPGKNLLFTLEFDVRSASFLPQEPLLWSSNLILENLIYDEAGKEYPIQIDWETTKDTSADRLGFAVSPNPFSESLTAFIYAAKSGKAIVKLSDNHGFLFAKQVVDLNEGDNAIELQTGQNARPGVYFLSVELDGQKIQRRVVKL